MNFYLKIFGVLLAFIAIHFGPSSSTDPQCQTHLDWAKKSAEPLSDFTIQLYRAISANDPQKNIIFSPVSIALALALLEAGAVNDTRSQIRFALVKRGSNDLDTGNIYQSLQKQLQVRRDDVKLNVVNGFYHQEQLTLKEGYLNNARQCFETVVQKCDFRSNVDECRRKINAWVANNTNQKIEELFKRDSLNSQTVSVLANAVYFKAPWEESFTVQRMETGTFYRFGQETDRQQVRYMKNEDQFLYTTTSSVSVVGIPYKNGDFEFFIVLPKKRDGLGEMERTLTGTELLFLINRTQSHQVDLKIPKFKVRTSVDLKPILVALGLKNMFDDKADFGRMTEQKLFVDAAFHEAFIDVNENGTEAAAATGVALRPMSLPPTPIPFVADHPFVYAIVHKATRAIIFAGKVLFAEQ